MLILMSLVCVLRQEKHLIFLNKLVKDDMFNVKRTTMVEENGFRDGAGLR